MTAKRCPARKPARGPCLREDPVVPNRFNNPARNALLAAAERDLSEAAELLQDLEERIRSLGISPKNTW